MAKRKIFIEGVTEHKVLQRKPSCLWDYSYNERGTLMVYRDGQEKAKRIDVKPGEAFFVEVKDGKTHIRELSMPQRDTDLLMWLLSFGTQHRAHNARQYLDKLYKFRARYDCPGYQELTINDKSTSCNDSYAFTICTTEDGSTRRVAAMIGREPTKAMIKEMLQRYTQGFQVGILFPRPFVEGLLRTRFGFTDADLADIKDIPYWEGRSQEVHGKSERVVVCRVN